MSKLIKRDELAEYADVAHEVYSHHLEDFRKVYVFLPPSYGEGQHHYPVLYINDGQDVIQLGLKHVLHTLFQQGAIPELIVVAMPAMNRLQEYGTANIPDYAHRGANAARYTGFVVSELLPFVNALYRTVKDARQTSFIGFSLGGLSALDICWSHPFLFGKVGVFSGSLWWRRKDLNDSYSEDDDRIMHYIIRNTHKKQGLRFWFEAGTNDEKDDRNNNGIIDAIDDTLDLMDELEKKGYVREQDFTYLQIEGGEHNFRTWHEALPYFLKWAYGN